MAATGRLGDYESRLGELLLGAPEAAAGVAAGVGLVRYRGFAPAILTVRSMRALLRFPNVILRPCWRVRVGGLIAGAVASGHYGSKVYKKATYYDAGAVEVDAISGSVRLGWTWDGIGVAQATVLLAAPIGTSYLTPEPNHIYPVCIELGYLDALGARLLEQVFLGWLQQPDAQDEPTTYTLNAVGLLSRAQQPLKHQVAIHKQHHWQAVQTLLDKAAVPAYDLDGRNDNIGDTYTYKVQGGTPAASILGQWGRDFTYPIWDMPDGTPLMRQPSLVNGNWGGIQWTIGDTWDGNTLPILEGSTTRQSPRQARKNRVKVLGRMMDDPRTERAHDTRHDDSTAAIDLIGNPPHFLTEAVESDVIEYRGLAQYLSVRHMRRVNKVPSLVSIVTTGNPYLKPADVMQVFVSRWGLDPNTVDTHHVVTGLVHDFGDQGFTTTLALEGNKGSSGEVVDTDPHAFFSYTSSGPDADGIYTVTCDGTDSGDPDGADPDALQMEWWNNRNNNQFSANYGEGGTAYVARFTQADWTAGVEISLRVTDSDRLWTIAKATVS